MDQGRGHSGIHPAGNSAQHPALPHLFLNPVDGLLDVGCHAPGGLAAADLAGEILQNLFSLFGMDYFGMKLDPVNFLLLVDHRGEFAVFSRSQDLKTRRDGRDAVAMAHPDVDGRGNAGQEAFFVLDLEFR